MALSTVQFVENYIVPYIVKLNQCVQGNFTLYRFLQAESKSEEGEGGKVSVLVKRHIGGKASVLVKRHKELWLFCPFSLSWFRRLTGPSRIHSSISSCFGCFTCTLSIAISAFSRPLLCIAISAFSRTLPGMVKKFSMGPSPVTGCACCLLAILLWFLAGV